MKQETIFDPRIIGDRSMQDAYPELKRIREFEKLSPMQMKFVWYYSSQSSPFFTVTSVEDRCKLSIKESKIKFQSDRERDLYLLIQFPEAIKEACDRMSRMDYNVRSSAKDMVIKLFANYAKYVDSYSKENADTYISATQKISRELPNLIKLKEEGFGVQDDDKRKNASKGQDIAKEYLQGKEDL